MSEHRRYREFSAQQKTELVLASLRGPTAEAAQREAEHRAGVGGSVGGDTAHSRRTS
jgi:hypothetical protein